MPRPHIIIPTIAASALLAWYTDCGHWQVYAGLLLCLLLAVRCLFSEPLIRLLYRPRPATIGQDRELLEMVETLARQASLEPPRVYVIESPIPNALAAGCGNGSSLIALTSSLIRLLDRNELAGVVAHELAHLSAAPGRRLELFAAPLYGGIGLLADLSQRALLFSADHPPRRFRASLIRLLARSTATLGQAVRCRSRELEADTRGAEICGNPLWLARALRKLAPFEHEATSHRQTNPGPHPPIGERIRRLEAKSYGAYL